MAIGTVTETSSEDTVEQMWPDWVYHVPEAFLITVGFGGLILQIIL